MKTMNERPFELFGMSSSDYVKWCEDNGLKPHDPDARRLFFKHVLKYEIVKKNGVLVDMRKEK